MEPNCSEPDWESELRTITESLFDFPPLAFVRVVMHFLTAACFLTPLFDMLHVRVRRSAVDGSLMLG